MMDFSRFISDFPNLKRKINGKRLVYLDSTASTLKPQAVIDAVSNYYSKYSVNIFRGLYKLSEEATNKYEEAREKTAQFINAKSSSEIIFVRNATEALNLIAYSWGRKFITNASEMISTVMEHHANLVTWQQLALEKDAIVRFIDINSEGIISIKSIVDMVNSKTKLLAITLVSNVLGTINPVKEIISQVKKKNPGIIVIVDGAQAVPHMKVDVSDLGCDFLAFSGHKMLAPTGIGVLWGKLPLLEEMSPYQLGGDMIKEVYLEKTTFQKSPHKFEAGTPHIAGAIGLGAAMDYLTDIGMENIREHEIELTSYAMERMENIEGVTIHGPNIAQNRGGVLAFSLKNIHSHDVAQVLDDDNICVRSGHHCAMPLHTRLKIAASTRASFYIYNTKRDIDALIAGLIRVKEIFKV